MRASVVQASKLLGEKRVSTLTTGYAELDELVGNLNGGQFYLFYGRTSFIDTLLHRLIVRGSKLGKVAYMNNTDYYSDKTLLNVDKIAFYAKRESIEPSKVLKHVYFVAAYNELRQPKATTALEDRMRNERMTRLIVAHRISRFLSGARDRQKALENLNRSLSCLWHLSVERNVVMVVTADSFGDNLTRLPRPSGTTLMQHMANVMVFFRELGSQKAVQTVLVKHPEKKTPRSMCFPMVGEVLVGKNNTVFQTDVSRTSL